MDVLFIGNSYTFYVPGMVESLSRALGGPRVRSVPHHHPGVTLRQHLDDGHLPGLLSQAEPLELVVIQEQSTLGVGYRDKATGSLSTAKVFHASAREIVSLVRKTSAQPVFYATWAKKSYPAQADPLHKPTPRSPRTPRHA